MTPLTATPWRPPALDASTIAWPVVVEVRVRVTSPGNNKLGNWRAVAARTRKEKEAVALAWLAARAPCPIPLPVVVTLCRIGPGRGLDDDNLAASCKAVRDAVATMLDVPRNKRGHAEDRCAGLTWRYEQERGEQFAVRVAIEPRETP